MNMKFFECGLCKVEKRIKMTRSGLREHLKEEHRIRSEVTNTPIADKVTKSTKQRWWIES